MHSGKVDADVGIMVVRKEIKFTLYLWHTMFNSLIFAPVCNFFTQHSYSP